MRLSTLSSMLLIDARGNVLMVNSACEKLFQYAANEVIGQNVKMLMPAAGKHDRYIDNLNRTGVEKMIGIGREVLGQRRDGTTFSINLSLGGAKQEDGSIVADLPDTQ